MGLIALISRKLNPEKYQQNNQLRAPPYESKISSRSPVRVVQTVSVSQSGKDAAREPNFTNGHPLCWDFDPPDDTAPSPVVLGFRDDYPRRPATSHGMHQSGAFQDSFAIDSAVSARGSRFSLKSNRPGTPSQDKLSRWLPKPRLDVQGPRSIRTEGSAKGYVDLLDAQSEIKPADFRTRVIASGARDYGEDVADRNIGLGSNDINPLRLQPFYPMRVSELESDIDKRRPFSSWETSSNEKKKSAFHQHLANQGRVDTASWSRPFNLEHRDVFSERAASPTARAASPMTFRSMKRRSLSSTVSVLDAFHPDVREPAHARHSSLQVGEPPVGQANRAASAWDATPETVPNWAFPTMTNRPPSRNSSLRSHSHGLSRRLSISAKSTAVLSEENEDEDDDSLTEVSVEDQTTLSSHTAPSHLLPSMDDSEYLSASRATRHGTHSLTHPDDTITDHLSLPYHRERTSSLRKDWLDDIPDRESAPSPSIKISRASQIPDSIREYTRARSALSSRTLSRTVELDEQGAMPSESARHWSISSATPTTSSTSSATFARPQSQHTANTSVDLGGTAIPSMLKPSLGSLSATSGTAQLSAGKTNAPAIVGPPELHIDDCTSSSDEDSYVDVNQQRKGGADLQFDAEYGDEDEQLAGSDDDSDAAPAPVIMPRNPRLSMLCSFEDLRQSYNKSSPASNNEASQEEQDNDVLTLMGLSPSRNASRYQRFSSILEEALEDGKSQTTGGHSSAKKPETVRMSALIDKADVLPVDKQHKHCRQAASCETLPQQMQWESGSSGDAADTKEDEQEKKNKNKNKKQTGTRAFIRSHKVRRRPSLVGEVRRRSSVKIVDTGKKAVPREMGQEQRRFEMFSAGEGMVA